MARIRLIRPEFFEHEKLYEAEATSGLPIRLAFAGLWCVADREGRFRWRPKALKLHILPYDHCDFGAILEALERFGFVFRYEVAGETYGAIPTWTKHQKPHPREQESTIPAPEEQPGLCAGHAKVVPAPALGMTKAQPRLCAGTTLGAPKVGTSPSDSDSDSDSDTDTEGAPKFANPNQSEDKLTPELLANAWCFQLRSRRGRIARDKEEDIAIEVGEWIRLGVPPEAILSEINRIDRDRTEQPWEMKKRLLSVHLNGRSNGQIDSSELLSAMRKSLEELNK